MKPKVVVIIPARMSSERLPGKVLLTLNGRCVLQWVLDRVGRAGQIDEVVVATTKDPEDDPIEAYCGQRGVACFRGSREDVLDRFVTAATTFNADLIIRVNADSPLVDPTYIDELVSDTLHSGVDYESYRLGNGSPVVLSALSILTEAVTATCLERAKTIITDKFEREHVTLGIYKRPSIFRLRFLEVPKFCDKPYLRLTLDTQADFDVLSHLFRVLGDKAEIVGADEIVQLVEKHPEWKDMMSEQNELNPKFSEK